ncbi:hypothetical protein OSB04_025152 [Centaurea solstitialis]|uniref:FMP27/BLTP2/Hobbit GFWDK motif-containing RBG unit domain-containing protein n=1 Tax=Centaurea solstitialis TaxID=347529 RepID=A0AA38SMJ7_9ASTR|nr:hypothetical protein OSB04_025152 [Centaurea solstitialis]
MAKNVMVTFVDKRLPNLPYIFFRFISRILGLILSRVLKASVGFRFSGWRSLRDFSIKFERGAVESVSVGEIKLCLQQLLVRPDVESLSKDPKLKLMISNIEVVTRTPDKSSKKSKPRKPKSSKSKSNKGKLMAGANMARFLSLCVRGLVVKTPKATLEIKDLTLDITKDPGSKPSMYLKLQILPIVIHLGEPHVGCDSLSSFKGSQSLSSRHGSTLDKSSGHFICEEFGLLVEFGSHREMGVIVKNIDLSLGEISVNLDEDSIPKKQKSSDSHANEPAQSTPDPNVDKKQQKKQAALLAITKNIPLFPEKVSLTLPKLDVKFVHKEHHIVVENNITALQFKSIKSQSVEDVAENTRLDLQLDFNEIHLLKDGGSSVLDILDLGVISFFYIPLQPTSPIKSEIDIKLRGIHCNIIMAILKPLMKLRPPKKTKTVPKDESTNPPVKVQPSEDSKIIMWTCTFAAPETTISLSNLDRVLVYHGCLQSSHLFANNTSSTGTVVHFELGDLNLQMADEYQESLKPSFFVVETNTFAVIHIAKVILDLGKKDTDSASVSQDVSNLKSVLSVDVTGICSCLTSKRVQSLLSTALLFKTLLKSPSPSVKKPAQSQAAPPKKPSGKGIQLIKINLERFSVNLCGDASLDNEVVDDPKRVNYGSQGGRVLITVLPDGTLRTAKVASTASNERKAVKYSIGLEIIHLRFAMNKDKQSTQVELDRVRSVYHEIMEDESSGAKVALFDMQKAKFLKQTSSLKEVSVCSLFSATTITARWEPDVQIALIELVFRLKLIMHNHKLQEQKELKSSSKDNEVKKEPSVDVIQPEKNQKKKESLFAVDVEILTITAEAGDGVETMIQVQSIFSENARIGILLEGLMLSFNATRVIKSGRMQLSRIPNASDPAVKWDYVIQGLDLVADAKKKIILPPKQASESESATKPKKPSSSKLGRVKLYIRKLTAEIEEEPLQGWLDEHYHLRKNVAHEMAVRLNFLDELLSKGSQSSSTVSTTDDPNQEGKSQVDGTQDKTCVQDASSVEKLKEELYEKSFRAYYEACQARVISEGSGACQEGFESGFKFSTSRTSLFSITGTMLDLTLTAIEGGEAGMIEVVKKLDPVARECNIPFARVYGSNLNLQVGSLVVQLRDYTYPLLAATSGKCEGRLVLAQQATPFQPQTLHEVYIGKWRKVEMYRSVGGTTPPMKTFLDLPLHFQKGEVSFGVGFEPPLADLSYAFTVALRRANLSVRNPNPFILPPKKEKSLPWWDEMRNYIHGKTTLSFSEILFNILGTADPYEKSEKLQLSSGYMEIQQSDGRIYVSAKEVKIFTSSLDSLLRNSTIKPPSEAQDLLHSPFVSIWPLKPIPSSENNQSQSSDKIASFDSPTISVAPHDIVWLMKFGNLNCLPPMKLRFFSRYPRFGVPRVARSGNLALDKVMTEVMARVDVTPACIRHMSLDENDPARGLTFKMSKIKSEMYLGRGKQKFTFDSPRDLLGLVYQGIDLHMPKVYLNKEDCTSVIKVQTSKKTSQVNDNPGGGTPERHRDDGFLLSSDYFIIRKQSPKADCSRLLAWQDAWKRSNAIALVKSESRHGSDSDDQKSDGSDDDGYNVVMADNCQRVFVYGLKLLWTIENRNGMLSWGSELAKAATPPKPSPSRRYAQRKLLEESQPQNKSEPVQEGNSNTTSSGQDGSPPKQKEASQSDQTPSDSNKVEDQTSDEAAKQDNVDGSEEDEEGTCLFMVNVIQPQFNLHSEEANGRFLLAAVSGRVLARSFHKVVNVGIEVIEQALSNGGTNNSSETQPELVWNRSELSVMLEHVQAHVAPTDVDPGAGVQWLPKIRRSSPKVKRTGALLEQVFRPCDMYFRYTRHKSEAADLKVKPLKELAFNSDNIVATITSRQFQVMQDVMNNLMARPQKPQKSSPSKSAEDDEDMEEEPDVVVRDGIEEVELARVHLEQEERAQNLLYNDIRKLAVPNDTAVDVSSEKEGDMWMVTGGRSVLVQKLRKELVNTQKSRKAAAASLRVVLLKAAEQQLIEKEKEKNKGPSCAMRVSFHMKKVAWSMLLDAKAISEIEINDLTYDFDRDYKDIGVARFTIKYCVVKNCLPNAKSDTLLAAWNPPSEWGKKVMIRVDAKVGARKDGASPIELFQADVYPLKIHLTESMYRVMWGYFFPEEEQDSQRRQEVWKVSTTAGLRKGKKGSEIPKELEGSSKGSADPLASKKAKPSAHELRRTSSFDRTWEETVAESVANELLEEMQSSSMSLDHEELTKPTKSKDSKTAKNAKTAKPAKPAKASKTGQEETKAAGKPTENKKAKPEVLREFHNIRISQVELLVTYEGSRFAVSDLRLLMDSFHRVEFTGTWKKLLARVKKHVIWSVLKSVTGMQGKKFKDKLHGQNKEPDLVNIPTVDHDSDSDGGSGGNVESLALAFPRPTTDGAGDGFVTSVRGLFHTQRRKAKAFVLRTMRNEGEEPMPGEWSDHEDYSPFARQLTITKAKRLIRRHTRKYSQKGRFDYLLIIFSNPVLFLNHPSSGGFSVDSVTSSPRDPTASDSDTSSSESDDPFEEYLQYKAAQEKAAQEKENQPSTQ